MIPLSPMELLSASGRPECQLHTLLPLLRGSHRPPVAAAEAPGTTATVLLCPGDTMGVSHHGYPQDDLSLGCCKAARETCSPLLPQTLEGHALLFLTSPSSPHSATRVRQNFLWGWSPSSLLRSPSPATLGSHRTIFHRTGGDFLNLHPPSTHLGSAYAGLAVWGGTSCRLEVLGSHRGEALWCEHMFICPASLAWAGNTVSTILQ